MAAVCAGLILGQINFDLALPDYMSSLTVLIKTPGSTLSDILHTGLEMLGCTLASAVLCVICGYLTAKVTPGIRKAKARWLNNCVRISSSLPFQNLAFW